MPKSDFFSFGGAHILAKRIKAHWLARGKTILTRVEPLPAKNNHQLWAVRSDLLNALPREASQ